jgi:hypothetical protein
MFETHNVDRTSTTDSKVTLPAPPAKAGDRRERLARILSVRNIGAIYVWIAIIILFSIISPDVSRPRRQPSRSSTTTR